MTSFIFLTELTGYWNANVEVDRHLNPNNVQWFSFNASLSSSFIGSSYLTILEKVFLPY